VDRNIGFARSRYKTAGFQPQFTPGSGALGVAGLGWIEVGLDGHNMRLSLSGESGHSPSQKVKAALSDMVNSGGTAQLSANCIQPIGSVQNAHRQFSLVLVDHHADLDFAGRDRLDVDAAVGQ